MTPWSIILGQCPCSGGGRTVWWTWLLVAASLYGLTWWAESVKKTEGVSRMKSKLTKLAVVVVLAGIIVAVLVMKKARTTAASASPPAREALADSPAALPRLLDLGSTSCIPCRMMAPILEQLKTEQAGKIQVDFIDVWKDEQAGKQYGINLIPTQIFFDGSGKELYRHEGFISKEDILAKWQELGVKLAQAAASQPLAGLQGATHE